MNSAGASGGPSSPLVPLDPFRFRELVERQQTPSSIGLTAARPSPDTTQQQGSSNITTVQFPSLPSPNTTGRCSNVGNSLDSGVSAIHSGSHPGLNSPIPSPIQSMQVRY